MAPDGLSSTIVFGAKQTVCPVLVIELYVIILPSHPVYETLVCVAPTSQIATKHGGCVAVGVGVGDGVGVGVAVGQGPVVAVQPLPVAPDGSSSTIVLGNKQTV